MPSLAVTPVDNTAAYALLGLPEPKPKLSPISIPAPVDPLGGLGSFPEGFSVTDFLRDLGVRF